MSKIFFTADLHFGHKNINKYCNRPYKNTEEADNYLINKWNSVVNNKDTIYVLGDFAFNSPEKYLKKLNGRKILIKGNHDRRPILKHGWAEIHDYLKIKYQKIKITLCHYPMLCWDGQRKDHWMLHGHTHSYYNNEINGCLIDVGVDANYYAPISFEQIKGYFNS